MNHQEDWEEQKYHERLKAIIQKRNPILNKLKQLALLRKQLDEEFAKRVVCREQMREIDSRISWLMDEAFAVLDTITLKMTKEVRKDDEPRLKERT